MQTIQFRVHSLSSKTFLFQVIQFRQIILIKKIIKNKYSFCRHSYIPKRVFFFSNNSVLHKYAICPIDTIVSGATTPGQSGPGTYGNEGVPCILQFPTQHHWNLTIRLFRVISWTLCEGVLPLCRSAVGVFKAPSNWAILKLYLLMVNNAFASLPSKSFSLSIIARTFIKMCPHKPHQSFRRNPEII